MTDVSDRLKKVILKIKPGADLNSEFSKQFDSIAIAFLLVEIEKEFHVSFPTSKLLLMSEVNFENIKNEILKAMKQNI